MAGISKVDAYAELESRQPGSVAAMLKNPDPAQPVDQLAALIALQKVGQLRATAQQPAPPATVRDQVIAQAVPQQQQAPQGGIQQFQYGGGVLSRFWNSLPAWMYSNPRLPGGRAVPSGVDWDTLENAVTGNPRLERERAELVGASDFPQPIGVSAAASPPKAADWGVGPGERVRVFPGSQQAAPSGIPGARPPGPRGGVRPGAAPEAGLGGIAGLPKFPALQTTLPERLGIETFMSEYKPPSSEYAAMLEELKTATPNRRAALIAGLKAMQGSRSFSEGIGKLATGYGEKEEALADKRAEQMMRLRELMGQEKRTDYDKGFAHSAGRVKDDLAHRVKEVELGNAGALAKADFDLKLTDIVERRKEAQARISQAAERLKLDKGIHEYTKATAVADRVGRAAQDTALRTFGPVPVGLMGQELVDEQNRRAQIARMKYDQAYAKVMEDHDRQTGGGIAGVKPSAADPRARAFPGAQ